MLVNQGMNKGNFVAGGGLKMKLEKSEKQEMIARVRKRIAELKEKGQWQKT